MRVAGIGKLPCRKCMGGGQTADTGTVRQAGASVILGVVHYSAWRSPQLNVTGSADRALRSSASSQLYCAPNGVIVRRIYAAESAIKGAPDGLSEPDVGDPALGRYACPELTGPYCQRAGGRSEVTNDLQVRHNAARHERRCRQS